MSNSFTKLIEADTSADTPTIFAVDGSFRVKYTGTFGGGTVKLQERMADGSYADVLDTEKTAEDGFIVDNFKGNQYQIVLTGSASPALSVSVKGNLQRVPS
jgi:hypothetical protein